MVNKMPNPWNEWQKLASKNGMILGMNPSARANLFNAAKANLVEAGLPLTGTSIFESALELRAKSPQPEATEASGISGRTQAEVEKFGRDAAANWEDMTPEQKDKILDYAEQNEGFHEAFRNGMIDIIGPGASDSDDSDETDDETKDDAGEETKDDAGEDTGEEPKEEHAEKSEPSLKRTTPMDDDERKQALKDLLGNYAPKETLVDDMGLPLGKEALLTLAQLTPIWGTLTDQQKGLFLEEQDTFALGRQYVTSARKLRKPKNIRRKLQTSSGQVIFI